MPAIRTELPDGGYHILYENNYDYWCDSDDNFHRDDGPARSWANGHMEYHRHGKLHRLDGPAVTYRDGDIEYWVDDEIPIHILDIVIIFEDIDFEMFPSAEQISNYYDNEGRKAYRVGDPDELILAILRYG